MAEHASYSIEDLDVGMSATFEKPIGESEVMAFADVSGDNNPVHVNEAYAADTMFKQRIAHGMLTASLISTVIATRLPGNGTIYLSQSLRFRAPVFFGQTVIARVEISKIDASRKRVSLECTCHVGDKVVLDGEATVMVPARAAQDAAAPG